MGAKINLINSRFNRLTVIKESEQRLNNLPTWICKCDCGAEVLATTKALRKGSKQSCGCLKKKDLIGKKFGKLTVIGYTDENRHGSALWKCQCECGNITYATTEGLRVGDNTSCGCYNKAKELFKLTYKVNLVGNKYGKLTVLGATDLRSKNGNQIWKCQCECGNICYITTNHLQTGNTKSCGCLQGQSYGEIEIKALLEQNNIPYKAEYIFPDLSHRRYDFAIFDANNNIKYLIEFDGEQHYFEASFFKLTLQEQQKIDEEKTNFAIQKNIPLIRIPYWKRGKITLEDIII